MSSKSSKYSQQEEYKLSFMAAVFVNLPNMVAGGSGVNPYAFYYLGIIGSISLMIMMII
jgi:hypothetical protein